MIFERAANDEWLETNGLGGYASASLCGANTRRYHGLLVAATLPPAQRVVLLSKLDERVIAGGAAFDLSTNQFPGAVHPRGFEYLTGFERDLFPVFEYAAGGVRLRKTIAAIHGQNTTIVVYEVLEAAAPFTFELRPFLTARDYHALGKANDYVHRQGRFEGDVYEHTLYDGVPALFVSLPGFAFAPRPEWYYAFEYARELERGFEGHEDLFTPGVFRRQVAAGAQICVIASTERRGGDGFALLETERRRREELLQQAGQPEGIGRALVLAADQFIVRRGAAQRSIIAGYHWFTDWGRDAMIALPGLCLATRRFDDGREILRTFIGSLSEGMLPNRFPDYGRPPEYNTVDATLWLFIAAWHYVGATNDNAFARETLLPVLREVIDWHVRGTRYNIHEDADGLLSAGSAADQLTWMDVKIGDEVIVQRHGKAVEVNALWYNALRILSDFEQRWGPAGAADRLLEKAARTRENFQRTFWNETRQCLYDVVRGDERDASIRPNQIFAIGLPFSLLDERYASAVLQCVEAHLVTPFGLRTLSPDDPRFVAQYAGGSAERDRAYHQGTVWAWLIAPYVAAWRRIRGGGDVRGILAPFERHLDEAGVGTVSEIFDALPPYTPRGCIAQAWSVAAVIRVMNDE